MKSPADDAAHRVMLLLWAAKADNNDRRVHVCRKQLADLDREAAMRTRLAEGTVFAT